MIIIIIIIAQCIFMFATDVVRINGATSPHYIYAIKRLLQSEHLDFVLHNSLVMNKSVTTDTKRENIVQRTLTTRDVNTIGLMGYL